MRRAWLWSLSCHNVASGVFPAPPTPALLQQKRVRWWLLRRNRTLFLLVRAVSFPPAHGGQVRYSDPTVDCPGSLLKTAFLKKNFL